MEKIKAFMEWLKSKPLWIRGVFLALIAALLFVLSLSSCSASGRVQRSGVHIDTVRVDYIIHSRNFTVDER